MFFRLPLQDLYYMICIISDNIFAAIITASASSLLTKPDWNACIWIGSEASYFSYPKEKKSLSSIIGPWRATENNSVSGSALSAFLPKGSLPLVWEDSIVNDPWNSFVPAFVVRTILPLDASPSSASKLQF